MKAIIAFLAASASHSIVANAIAPIQITLKPMASNELPNVVGILIPRPTVFNSIALDGRLSYEFLGERFNFTMVQNRGYVTVESLTTREILRNDCLRRANIPPISAFVESLRSARVIDDTSVDVVDSAACYDGKVIEFTVGPEVYTFCSRVNNAITQVNGQDTKGILQLLQDNTIDAPNVADFVRPGGERLGECEILAEETLSLPMLRRRTAEAPKDCSTSCRNGKKICLFVHGLGVGLDAPLASEYKDYWGNVSALLKCCSVTRFMRMDTVNNAWYDDLLAKKVCAAAALLTNSKNAMELEKIAIIAHSMGNLIMANAAMKKLCAIGPTSKWIALSGPMSGSRSANIGINVCTDRPTPLDDPIVGVLGEVGICPPRQTIKSLVFEGSALASAQLNSLYQQADIEFTRHVSSVMCGVDAIGLVTTQAAKYLALGVISGHASKLNDGAVDFTSCRGLIPETAFTTSWSSGNFYKAALNHGDVTLRNGDGWWGSDRKPVKWLNCQF